MIRRPRFGWTKLVLQKEHRPLGCLAAAIYDQHERRGVITLPADELARGSRLIFDMGPEYYCYWNTPSMLASIFPQHRADFDRALGSFGNAMSGLSMTDLLWCNEGTPVSEHLKYLRQELYLPRIAP